MPGYCLVASWLLFVTTWLLPGYYQVTAWLLPSYFLVTFLLLLGYYLVTSCLLSSYYLFTDWLLPGRPFRRKTKSGFPARVPAPFNWPLPLHPM